LLPGVSQVLRWRAPWIDPEPGEIDPDEVKSLIRQVRRMGPAAAVVFTSFHQSPLPTALVLRMAGVPRIAAISEDYPGSLLDIRHPPPADIPEAERNLILARAAGFELPPGDDGRLAVSAALPDCRELTGDGPYIAVHASASVPARAPSAAKTAAFVAALAAAGHRVVVTGSAAESALTAAVSGPATGDAGPGRVDLGGRTSLPMLAAVLAGADVVVAPNTGAAHLAAAVGTPVVSLFAPVVPAARWAPYGVPAIILGRQDAPCAGSRARVCPVPGHPCLDQVDQADVVAAVAGLSGRPAGPVPAEVSR
ncbi:MAG TPA: glycosyltransferase family 9 protein, partial [Streptosporangiaceae bacterium]|nr:glycosyltransferase family 9 protein [Streptosporangiaceae bacterium]